MSDIIQSLQRQLAEAEENLRLIQERKAEFVQAIDIPLQLIKDERRLEAQIADLQARQDQLMEAPRCPSCGAAADSGELFCSTCGTQLIAEPPLSTPPRASAEDIQVHIQGDVTGQVAVGNNILQIGSVHGGGIGVALSGQQPQPRPRPSPVFLRPPPFPSLLDREAEIDTAIATLQSAMPVELYGGVGIGKTTLLRHLAHHPVATSFPDGVIYLSARRRSVEDLLQSFFDAFYESDVPFKPTDGQLREALRDKRAFILLDDIDLARDEVDELIDAIPGCAFLLASSERCLWGRGRSVALHGLPPDDALVLVERELDRPLSPEEYGNAQALCTALEGHPLRILQAAAMAREEGSLTKVLQPVQTTSPAEALTAQALVSLPQSERRVLAALGALGSAPAHAENLAALTELPDTVLALEALRRRGLVQTDGARYSLAGTPGQTLQQEQDLTQWVQKSLSYYIPWAEAHRSEPKRLVEEAEPILQTLEWATRAGRWDEVLRLVRAVEGALALGMRWNDWALVLQWGLQAAQIEKNQSEEAWALHQLGLCAVALGDTDEARDHLNQALRVREAMGDRLGAAVTRSSLARLQDEPMTRRHRAAAPDAVVKKPKVSRPLRVFLCHASGDKPAVRDLYRHLRAGGIEPWLDEENLLPGQDWQLEIPKAVRSSDAVIICLSRKSTTKAGYVQKEIKYALDVADEQPEGTIFIIPVRLEECETPERLRRYHWVDLFEDRGYEQLMRALRVRAKKVEATVSPMC